MERKTDYKRLTASACAERILEIKNPIIFIHVRPDGDAVGSAAALSLIFRQLGYDAPIKSADKIPARLSFILERTGTAVADTVEGYTPVSIDTASVSQLGALYDEENLPALMIDHHAVGEQYADGYITPDASSAAEALFDIAHELESMGKIKFSNDIAYAIYTAMSSDTGCFAYSNATPKTHRYAAMLIEHGIDAADINQKLFHSKTKEQIKAEGYISTKLRLALDGRISYATLSYKELKSLDLEAEHFDTAIDVARSVFGAEIAFVIKETEPGKYKASLRSTGADVSKVAAKFGGGGHVRAAGCSPEADSIKEACEIIISEASAALQKEEPLK